MVTVANGQRAFGNLLRRHRQAVGLSQAELAERAGLSQRGIADLERGVRRSPYPATVRRLVEALGLDETARATLLAAAQPDTPASGPAQIEPTRSLPVPLSSFVGRERELTELRRLLATARLLTLVGPGGIGKTRLALQLAARLGAERPDRVAVVELAALTEPGLVPKALATVLGIPEQPGRRLVEILIDSLGSRQLLLVLDNCEHLIMACAAIADQLLGSCPNLSILATSREALGVAGETIWRVPSLSLPLLGAEPRLEVVGRAEAVQLFAERAATVMPEFSITELNARTIGDLCSRLDGIPLALELAAARVPVLSVEQIAERIDDALRLLTGGSRLAPPRQQTLRATLDWSYGLLAEPEQRLFDRLGVFAGGWTLEAAEAVCAGADIAPEEVLELLARLVSKSLVVSDQRPGGPARFRLLEPLRQYAQRRLAGRSETERLRDQHAAFFLALAERSERDLFGRGAMAALARLEQEHDNLRAALRWLLQQAEVDRGQRLAGALGRFWFFRGYLGEGTSWLAQALDLPGGNQPTTGRAGCLYGAGIVAMAMGNYPTAEQALTEALDLWRALDNAAEEGFTLFALGTVMRKRGDQAEARALLERSVEVSRAGGAGAAEANSLNDLAELAYDQGDDVEARAQAEAGLARASAVGWTRGAAVARSILGRVSQRQGDLAAATALLEASLADLRELGFRWWIAWTLADLGHLAIARGDLDRAGGWLAESLTLARQLGDRVGIARGLEGCGCLAAVQAQPGLALRLAGAAAALRAAIGSPLAPMDQATLDRRLAPADTALGSAASNAARADGATLGVEQAIACALALTAPGAPTLTAP